MTTDRTDFTVARSARATPEVHRISATADAALRACEQALLSWRGGALSEAQALDACGHAIDAARRGL